MGLWRRTVLAKASSKLPWNHAIPGEGGMGWADPALGGGMGSGLPFRHPPSARATAQLKATPRRAFMGQAPLSTYPAHPCLRATLDGYPLDKGRRSLPFKLATLA